MRITILGILLVSNILYANQQECIEYLKSSNESQDEMVLYIMNELDVDAYYSAKQALRFTIKSKIKCKGLLEKESMNFDKKIIELKGYVDKYDPSKMKK